MKEIRLNGVVLRPNARGWQVGEVGHRKRGGVVVEHLVRVKHFAHDQLPKAAGVFASMATARGPDRDDLAAVVANAVAVERAAIEAALRPERKRKKDGPRIYVRVDDEERTAIARAAEKFAKTPTEFVRDAAISAAHATIRLSTPAAS